MKLQLTLLITIFLLVCGAECASSCNSCPTHTLIDCFSQPFLVSYSLSTAQKDTITYVPYLVRWGGVAATALLFLTGLKNWGGARASHLILMLSCAHLTQYINFAPTDFWRAYFDAVDTLPMRVNWIPNLFCNIFSAASFSPTIYSGWKPIYFSATNLNYYFVDNFGSEIWTLIAYIFLLGVVNLIYLLRKMVSSRTADIFHAVKNYVQWNLLFIIFLAYAISFSFKAVVQYQVLDFESPYAILSFTLSCVFLVLIFPAVFVIFRWIRQLTLSEDIGISLDDSVGKGIFFKEWRTDRRYSKYYPLAFFTRFFINGLLIGLLTSYPFELLICLLTLNLIFFVLTIIFNPFAKKYDLGVTIFFECLFIFQLICVTGSGIMDFIQNYNVSVRDGFAWAFIVLVLLFIYSAVFLSVGELIYTITKYCSSTKVFPQMNVGTAVQEGVSEQFNMTPSRQIITMDENETHSSQVVISDISEKRSRFFQRLIASRRNESTMELSPSSVARRSSKDNNSPHQLLQSDANSTHSFLRKQKTLSGPENSGNHNTLQESVLTQPQQFIQKFVIPTKNREFKQANLTEENPSNKKNYQDPISICDTGGISSSGATQNPKRASINNSQDNQTHTYLSGVPMNDKTGSDNALHAKPWFIQSKSSQSIKEKDCNDPILFLNPNKNRKPQSNCDLYEKKATSSPTFMRVQLNPINSGMSTDDCKLKEEAQNKQGYQHLKSSNRHHLEILDFDVLPNASQAFFLIRKDEL